MAEEESFSCLAVCPARVGGAGSVVPAVITQEGASMGKVCMSWSLSPAQTGGSLSTQGQLL